ncbi:MAG TPA: hypothetical protein VGD77_08650 [Gemmatimonadaceae bacterium]
MRRVLILSALAALPALAGRAGAQSTLSTQGFGYPPGQLSARALATGGATAEIDALSATNPATLGLLRTPSLSVQVQPEFRTLEFGNASEKTNVVRFPVVGASIPFGPHWTVGLNASTLLDRTWETQAKRTQVIGSDTLATTESYGAQGAINDLRLGVAWTPRPWLNLGLGGHALTGSNRLAYVLTFDSATTFNPILSRSTISYGGNAVSAGVDLRAGRMLALGAAVRAGGSISAHRNDSTIATADVPFHYGVSAAFTGLPGSALAVRIARDNWSSLRSLGTDSLGVVDAWDIGAGADVAGPRLYGRQLMLRAGARWRDLPFQALLPGNAPPMPSRGAGTFTTVRERAFSGGLGTVMAGGRAALDVTLIRALRETATPMGFSEKAWQLSVGVSVRP